MTERGSADHALVRVRKCITPSPGPGSSPQCRSPTQFTTNQATLALPDAGVLFKVMVALPVEVLGTALTTQIPATAFCTRASTRDAVDRPPGTVTVADMAGLVIDTTPERLNFALPVTL